MDDLEQSSDTTTDSSSDDDTSSDESSLEDDDETTSEESDDSDSSDDSDTDTIPVSDDHDIVNERPQLDNLNYSKIATNINDNKGTAQKKSKGDGSKKENKTSTEKKEDGSSSKKPATKEKAANKSSKGGGSKKGNKEKKENSTTPDKKEKNAGKTKKSDPKKKEKGGGKGKTEKKGKEKMKKKKADPKIESVKITTIVGGTETASVNNGDLKKENEMGREGLRDSESSIYSGSLAVGKDERNSFELLSPEPESVDIIVERKGEGWQTQLVRGEERRSEGDTSGTNDENKENYEKTVLSSVAEDESLLKPESKKRKSKGAKGKSDQDKKKKSKTGDKNSDKENNKKKDKKKRKSGTSGDATSDIGSDNSMKKKKKTGKGSMTKDDQIPRKSAGKGKKGSIRKSDDSVKTKKKGGTAKTSKNKGNDKGSPKKEKKKKKKSKSSAVQKIELAEPSVTDSQRTSETIKPYTFFMDEGDIEFQQMAGRALDYNISSSSSNENLGDYGGPSVRLSTRAAPSGRGKTPSDDLAEVKQMEVLARLHRNMLEMQHKNFELTKAVAEAGAATASAVRAILESAKDGKLNIPNFDLLHNQGFRSDMIPSTPTPVFIKALFLSISEIDTRSQQFEAELYIEARWVERKFQGLSMQGLANIEFHQCWDPHLKILNLASDLSLDRTSMVLRYESESLAPVLVYMWHLKGYFREKMELQHFPFDVQEISVVVTSDLPATQVDLLEDTARDSSVNKGALQEGGEDWQNYRHIEFTRDVTLRELDSTSKHPVIMISAHVKRRLGSYFWNVAMVVFLILALTFTLLAVEPIGNDRLTIIMTLFLTAVAFKLVVKSSLPTISYLTYLDMYVIFTMVYLFLQAAESALMLHLANFKEPLHVREYDEIAQASLIAFLILFHLVFIIYIQITVLARRRRMVRLDHQFEMSKQKKKKERLEKQAAERIAAIANKPLIDL